VVDGKVINRELAWRNADRDRIRTEVCVGCTQLLQANTEISSLRYTL
jgi:hypothetical protein